MPLSETLSKPSNSFHFDPDRLAALADANRNVFSSGEPFPHLVVDSLFPDYVLDDVLDELPAVPRGDDNDMSPTRAAERGKTAHQQATFFGPKTTQLLYQLNAADFLDFLEKLTGIKGLISDLRLDGGGYHLTRRGGRLAIHTDFSHHRRWQLRRRLNLILYLNKNWKEEYGGHLELWDKDITSCKKRILPVFNRCVIFATDANSPHGQPDPLACPPDRGRQSLALYYFDNPSEMTNMVGTNYMNRPQEERLIKRILPPIIFDLAKRTRHT
jgi:hypothetical protein